MANEVTTSANADLLLAATLHQELQLLLADRQYLWGSPFLRYVGDVGGSGSAVRKVSYAGLNGTDEMAAVAEGSSVSNTALTDATVSPTVGRQALQRQITDLHHIVDSFGLHPGLLAQDMVSAAYARFTSMVTALSSGFSSSVGTSGNDMTVDDFIDAQITLMLANNVGGSAAMLHGRQKGDLVNSLRAEGGALQFAAATQAQIANMGPGYNGNFLGTDIFVLNRVPTANAGADRSGMMITNGAIVWADGSPKPVQGAGGMVMPAGTKIFVEFERDASGGLTKIVGNYYVGVAEGEDARGVAIITDA